jgi:FkbM family methyltransferase
MSDRIGAFLKASSHLEATDPEAFLEELNDLMDVRSHEARHVRARLLQREIARLSRLLALVDLRDPLYFIDGTCFVEVEGVRLETISNAYHLRGNGQRASAARKLISTLGKMGVAVDNIVDVGANYGEIALPLSRHYPGARIVAVEPGPDNIEVLQRNIAAQSFDTGNIHLVREAISSESGHAHFLQGRSTQNRIADPAEPNSVRVKTSTLAEVVDRCCDGEVALIKIDIEGHEPALAASVVQLGARVWSYFVEFTVDVDRLGYMNLFDAFASGGFSCRDEHSLAPLTRSAAEDHMERVKAAGRRTLNFWFIRGDRA